MDNNDVDGGLLLVMKLKGVIVLDGDSDDYVDNL